MDFGSIIQDARLSAGLNQKQLAAQIIKEDGEHISAPYLNDIEHNRRSPSSDHIIEQFSKVLKIRPELLYYAAGRIPTSVYKIKTTEERVVEAFEAFQQVLRGKNKGS